MPRERETEDVLEELHEVVQNNRYTASGKVQAITEVLYGPNGEYFDGFEETDEGPGDTEEIPDDELMD